MKMIRTNVLIFVSILLFFGCSKDQSLQTEKNASLVDIEKVKQSIENTISEVQAIKEQADRDVLPRNSGRVIVLDCDTHNALKEAVADARNGDIIYLRNGLHIETEPFVINKSIAIVGEKGSCLKLNSDLTNVEDNTLSLNPFIHILNAPYTCFIGVNIENIGDSGGSTALLFENSPSSIVAQSKISNFMYAIWVENSDRMSINANTLVGTSAWQTGEAPECESITVANGKSVYVTNNDVSNSLFGLWLCDKYGKCYNNDLHGNAMGLVACNVPPDFYKFPDGVLRGAKFPCQEWMVRNNNATDNAWGYLIIDGANNNRFQSNNAARNSSYDMELTTDTYRFGFLTPKAYSNKVNVGPYQHLRIKDCGVNNTIIGGVLVNTGSDPCN